MVPDTALRGAARDVVRDAIALERPHLAAVHRDRHRDDDRLLALLEDLDQVRVDLEDVRDLAELLLGKLERVLAEVGDGGFDGRHEGSFSRLAGENRREYTPLYLMLKATEARLGFPSPVGQAVSRSR